MAQRPDERALWRADRLRPQDVFGASDERYHLVGGNERLPKAVAAALPAGSVPPNTALTGIVQNADGTYTLTLKNPIKTFTTLADRVVMAIPINLLLSVFGTAPMRRQSVSS